MKRFFRNAADGRAKKAVSLNAKKGLSNVLERLGNCRESSGLVTAVFRAAAAGDPKGMHTLPQREVGANAEDQSGRGAAHWPAQFGSPPELRELLHVNAAANT